MREDDLNMYTLRCLFLCILLTLVPGISFAETPLAIGIADLANRITSSAKETGKKRIAVLSFRDLSQGETVLGAHIAEELATNLFNVSDLEIVERTMLDKAIGELKLGTKGVIDPKTAKEIGKFVGVDAIVTGTITDMETSVALNCRMIDVQTGNVFAAAKAEITKDANVNKIMASRLASPAGGGAGGGPQKPDPPAKPVSQEVMTKSVEGFTFRLQGCQLQGEVISCALSVTANQKDDRLYLWGTSRLIDDEGNELRASSVSLGNSETRRPVSVSANLVRDTPLKARVEFEGYKGAKTVKLIELVCSGFRVQFRNVPLR
jgi:TolB-like protein